MIAGMWVCASVPEQLDWLSKPVSNLSDLVIKRIHRKCAA